MSDQSDADHPRDEPRAGEVKQGIASSGPSPDGKPTNKHPLDYGTAAITAISLLLNVYLLYDKKRAEAIEQPGPSIYRIYMPAREAIIFDGLRTKKDLLFAAFPNPAFLLTTGWREARDAATKKSNLELRDDSWCFLTIRNFTNAQYSDAALQLNGTNDVSLGAIEAQSTRFFFCERPNCDNALRLKYRIAGDTAIKYAEVPKPTGTEWQMQTELDIKRLGSLEDVSDRVRALIRAKSSLPE